MLNPIPAIWKADPVTLPARPLSAAGLERIRSITRPHGLYLGPYPTCFGTVTPDYLSLRLATIPNGTFPPRLKARRHPNGTWTAVVTRTLFDRLWLTLWLGGMAAAAVLLGVAALRDYPDPGWVRLAFAALGVTFTDVMLAMAVRWSNSTWAWQRLQLAGVVAKGFEDADAV